MNRVAIVSGARTPFVKAGTAFKNLSALELGAHAVNGLLEKSKIEAEQIEELIFSIVIFDPTIPNLALEIVFKNNLPSSIKAHTVSNNCISGIHAIAGIYDSIAQGRADVGIAGGTESMSNPPIMFKRDFTRALMDASLAKSFGGQVGNFLKIRPWHFLPKLPEIAEPSTGLSMGEHCELMAKEWQISRIEQDEIAFASHQNAYSATSDGRLTAEIFPLKNIEQDLIIRGDSSPEKLAKLKPVFDKTSAGTITAGNSSPLTDGASAVLLMSEEKAKQESHEPLVFVKAFEFAAIDPKDGLLMAPCLAVPRLLQKTSLTLDDMDLVEIHEAFGAQVACNLAAWEKGWKEPAVGKVGRQKLNQLGSSIAIGHPFAATGGRIVTTLANEMKRSDLKYGLVSICAAGGMACAMILER